MIKRKHITPQTEDVWWEDEETREYLGKFNEWELYDLRVQIKEHFKNHKKCENSGYYVTFKEMKIPIDINGKFVYPNGGFSCPEGFFDFYDNHINKLLGI